MSERRREGKKKEKIQERKKTLDENGLMSELEWGSFSSTENLVF